MDTGLNRMGNECFYTKEDISLSLIQKIKNLNDFDLIIEPSAGNGSFLKNLNVNAKILAYDIEPNYKDIVRQDYLALETNFKENNILVIGNPPFGKASSLALKFIKKSCEFADAIAFILPRSFKKDSKYKMIPLNFHCILIEDLPDNSFTINGKDIDVPCSFFIYEKRTELREIKEPVQCNDNYFFIKKEEISKYNSVIAFKRVGGCAGKFISENVCNLSKESHYFIVFNKNIDYTSCTFETNNTVGPKSISKQELIYQLNFI